MPCRDCGGWWCRTYSGHKLAQLMHPWPMPYKGRPKDNTATLYMATRKFKFASQTNFWLLHKGSSILPHLIRNINHPLQIRGPYQVVYCSSRYRSSVTALAQKRQLYAHSLDLCSTNSTTILRVQRGFSYILHVYLLLLLLLLLHSLQHVAPHRCLVVSIIKFYYMWVRPAYT